MQRTAEGLGSTEAAARLAADGPNLLPQPRRPSLLRRLVGELVHFFALMLWVAGGLALVAGMPQLGVAIFAVILINAMFAFVQEARADRAADRLQILLPDPGDRAPGRQAADRRRRRSRRRRPPVARERRPGARRRVARHGQPAPRGHVDAHRGERRRAPSMTASRSSPAPSSSRARPGPWSSATGAQHTAGRTSPRLTTAARQAGHSADPGAAAGRPDHRSHRARRRRAVPRHLAARRAARSRTGSSSPSVSPSLSSPRRCCRR